MHPRILITALSALLAAAAIGVLGATTATARAKHRGCARHHRCHRPKPVSCAHRASTTLGTGAGASVFYIGGGVAEYTSPTTIYGCAAGARNAVKLESFGDAMSVGVAHIAVNASHVGWAITVTDEACSHYAPSGTNCSTGAIESFDLATGHRRLSVVGDADSLAMTDAGWVAWVPVADPSAPARSVLAFDSAGRRQLDSGAIDPHSLTASGATVSWTKAGAAASATLG